MRRRFAVLLCAVVAATSAALVPTSASAAVTDGGTLAAGAKTSVTFAAAGDETTFAVTVPAGARPSVTFDTTTGPAVVLVSLEWADGGVTQGQYFTPDLSTSFVELDPHPQAAVAHDATLRLHGSVVGSVSFTLRYAQDVVRPLTSGESTTVDFTDPAQQARLTFDATSGARVFLSVSASTLTPTAPVPDFYRPLSLWLISQGSLFQEGSTPGSFQPVDVVVDGTSTLLVDPGRDLTGSVTLTATVVPAGTPVLTYDVGPVTVPLDGTGPVSAAFVTQGGRATVVQAVAPSLTRDDGSQGTASLVLEVPGSAPVTLGTVSGDTVAFPTSQPLDAGLVAFLRLVPDGTTTGSAGLRVFLDKGPSTPVPVGAATPISIAAGDRTGRFSFDAAAGDTIELYLQNVSLTPDTAPGFEVGVEDGIGGVFGGTFLSPGGGSTVLSAPATGTYTLVVTVPDGVALSGTLFPVRSTTTVRRVTLPFDEVVTTTTPGEAVALVVPRAAGDQLVATAVPASPDPAFFVTLSSPFGFSNFGGLFAPEDSVFLESGRIDLDGDWLLTVDSAGSTTGSVRVRISDAPVVGGPLPPVGTPADVSITEKGGVARYTFAGKVGDPFMLDIGDIARTGGSDFDDFVFDVRRPDGSSYTTLNVRPGTGPAWLEVPDVLDANGTWSVVVDPTNAATGSFRMTRRAPRVVTGTLRPGTARTVSLPDPGALTRQAFSGKAGQRPVLTVQDQTVPARVRLIGPNGLVLADTSSFGPGYLEFPELPLTGTWTLEVDPFGAGTGSVTLLLGLVTDPVAPLRPGVATTLRYRLGENPTLRASVGKGVHLAVDLRTVAPEGTRLNVFFRRPDGSLADGQNVAAGSWVEMREGTDVEGRWSVVLDPEGDAVGSLGLVPYASPDKVVGNRIGKTTDVSVALPAQNVALPFRGVPSSGEVQFVSWKVTGSTYDLLTVRLVTPAGSTYTQEFTGPGDRTGVFVVPADTNGTWRIVADPLDGQTGKAQLFFAIGDLF